MGFVPEPTLLLAICRIRPPTPNDDRHDGIPVCLPAGGALELFQNLLGQQARNGLSNL